ncbi:MAG: gliding motility-associated C-terminal domain-containing protein [Bacteroidetes bacterium]|nr:gliding motility-associated C-terminal domain-containing protein [Bacteroidota bacterium]
MIRPTCILFCIDSACIQPAECTISFTLGNDTAICPNGSLLLDATTAGGTYLWNNGSINPTNRVTSAGDYMVTVTDPSGCSASDTITVGFGDNNLFVDLGNDRDVCSRGGLVLAPGISNATYRWQDNSTDSFYHVTQTGVYSVTVNNGCGIASDEVRLTIYPDECALLIPTAFSPNNDGMNDLFRAVCRCPTSSFSMKVFNRWGEMVYQTKNILLGWDGVYKEENQPLGVYGYECEYFNYCENKLNTISGNVSLLR